MTVQNIIVAVVILLGILFLLTRKVKEAEVEEYVMTAEEREEIIAEYSGKQAPFQFNEAITGEIKDFKVLYVMAYGVRHNTIEQALELSKNIPDDVRNKMKVFGDELKDLREERENIRRFYRVEQTAFDGEIYIYNPCKIKVDTPSRLNAGLPARIGLDIKRDEDNTVYIAKVSVATDDVSNASNVTVFDMSSDSEYESFCALMSQSKMYQEELDFIDKLDERMEKYNALVHQERITIDNEGTVTIKPPTLAQIEARRAALLGTKKPEPTVVEEAKKQVEDQFVSSTIFQ